MDINKFIFPNPDEKICVVASTGESEGCRLSKEDPLYSSIIEELKHPYFSSVIMLNQCSRNISHNDSGPNLIYLSKNDGGFSKTGISVDGESFPNLNYVELAFDEESIKRGELYIYPHELAHAMIKNLWPDYPEGQSTMPHTSCGITDYFTAFDEGFAEHFEACVHENIKRFSSLRHEKFSYEKNILKLWLSEFDSDLRITGVIKNNFIYKKLLPEALAALSLEEKILFEQNSYNFDITKLKNAQEMLSCEGVIASLFYSINTNSVLQNNYIPIEICSEFLLSPLPNSVLVSDVFSPYENIILKSLYVIHKMKASVTSENNIFIEFIRTWCRIFPKDRETLIKIFVYNTSAKTVEDETGRIYEKLSTAGILGQVNDFTLLLKAYRKSIENTYLKVLKDETILYNNLGKEAWVTTSINSPQLFFQREEKTPLRINLNTASKYQLNSVTRDR